MMVARATSAARAAVGMRNVFMVKVEKLAPCAGVDETEQMGLRNCLGRHLGRKEHYKGNP
jgi:hypothetical protein